MQRDLGVQLSSIPEFEKILFFISATEQTKVLDVYDLTLWVNSIKNQLFKPNSIYYAVAYIIEFYLKKIIQENILVDISQFANLRNQNKLSEKSESVFEVLEWIHKQGIPTIEGKSPIFNVKIDLYYMVAWWRLDHIKSVLLKGQPLLFILPLYSFEHDNFWDSIHGKFICFHCVSIFGYNEIGFIFANSWGSSWGNHGFGIFPFKDILNVNEIWSFQISQSSLSVKKQNTYCKCNLL